MFTKKHWLCFVAGFTLLCIAANLSLAYVPGGSRVDSLEGFVKSLRTAGWGVECGNRYVRPRGRDFNDLPDYKIVLPAKENFQPEINQLVAKAIQNMPAKDAPAISTETKRTIAEKAEATIRAALDQLKSNHERLVIDGLIVNFGVTSFESYSTDREGNTEGYAHGLVPYVAVRKLPGDDGAKRVPKSP